MNAIFHELTDELMLVIRKSVSMYLRRFDEDLYQDACLAFCLRKPKPNYTTEKLAHLTAKTVVLSYLKKEKNRKRISAILSEMSEEGESLVENVAADKLYDEFEMAEYRVDNPDKVEKAKNLKVRRGRPILYNGSPLRL